MSKKLADIFALVAELNRDRNVRFRISYDF